MAGQNNVKFLNHAILLFTGAIIAIGVLSYLNGSINWTGIVIMVVFVGLLIAYRGRLNKK